VSFVKKTPSFIGAYQNNINILLQLVKVQINERRISMSKTITPWGLQCKSQMVLNGLSLNDLSKSVGLSRTYISAIINGRIYAPDETVEKINKALGMEIADNA
jgi:cyanate lyase